MGAACTTLDPNIQKIIELKKKYEIYNREAEEDHNGMSYKRRRDYLACLKSTEMWNYYKMFHKYKKEIETTNNELYQKLFVKDLKKEEIEVRNIHADDEPKFIFFFNKREFESVTMLNCNIIFPRFNRQYFPQFDKKNSKLKRIVINDSIIVFDMQYSEPYSKLEYAEYLDLSFNNIEELSEHFRRLLSLKTLQLKSNSLTSLPNSFVEMELVELNLTDNKISKVPLLNFNTLVKLNLSMNKLRIFECSVEAVNPPLSYLFLARNELKEIPKDILKFKRLTHVALDGNKIKEIPDWVRNELDFKVSISLMNNNIQNKDMFSRENKSQPELFNDILEVNPIGGKISKVEEVFMNYERVEVLVEEEEEEEEEDIKPEQKEELERILKSEEISDAKHYLEMKINKRVFEMLMNQKKHYVSKGSDIFRMDIKLEKLKIVCEELKQMIDCKQESEIAKFGDFELKKLIKVCYGVINKYEEYLILGVVPQDLNDRDREIFNYLKEKGISQVSPLARNDLDNLVFLCKLESLLVNSKVVLFLKYLANIDSKLSSYIKTLTELYDPNSFIMLVTELKLFLKTLMEVFERKPESLLEIKYEHKISQNVIHKIFVDPIAIKILYRLGLSGFKSALAEFKMNHLVHEKQQLVENFLQRFIKVLKLNKI